MSQLNVIAAASTVAAEAPVIVPAVLGINDSGSDVGPMNFSITTSPVPKPTPDFIIPLGDRSWDGIANGVQPGDVIGIEGGSRGPLIITNVIGTDGNRVLIQSDETLKTTFTSSNTTTDYPFELKNCENFILDGSNTLNEIYGFFITSTFLDNVNSYLKFNGLTTKYTVRYVEIDGKYPAITNRGTGISQNDQNVKEANNPGFWREDVLIEFCQIQNVHGEGMYIGPNYGNPAKGDVPLRNIEIRNNRSINCGRDGINLKSTIEGSNTIHDNFIKNSGIRFDDAQPTLQKLGIGIFEGYGDIYNNFVIDSGEHGIHEGKLYRPASLYPNMPPARIWNNVVARSGWSTDPLTQPGRGITVGGGSGQIEPAFVEIYNNTVIDTENTGINVSNSVTTLVTINNNIIVDIGGPNITAPGGADTLNNQTGTSVAQDFVDVGGDDFRLTATSPALDNATVGLTAPDDIDGVSRPQGAAKDQGAYEKV